MITIPSTLPGLNEYTAANRTHRQAGAAMKRAAEDDVQWHCGGTPTIHGRVNVSIDWYEPNARRDPDNVMFAVKFILDALVENGIIDGDGQKVINGISHRVMVDRENPRIEVTIEAA